MAMSHLHVLLQRLNGSVRRWGRLQILGNDIEGVLKRCVRARNRLNNNVIRNSQWNNVTEAIFQHLVEADIWTKKSNQKKNCSHRVLGMEANLWQCFLVSNNPNIHFLVSNHFLGGRFDGPEHERAEHPSDDENEHDDDVAEAVEMMTRADVVNGTKESWWWRLCLSSISLVVMNCFQILKGCVNFRKCRERADWISSCDVFWSIVDWTRSMACGAPGICIVV